jgi:hypothetical protein
MHWAHAGTAAVAQIFNLLYRRIAFGRASCDTKRFELATPCGLQVRDTAQRGWRPACCFFGGASVLASHFPSC